MGERVKGNHPLINDMSNNPTPVILFYSFAHDLLFLNCTVNQMSTGWTVCVKTVNGETHTHTPMSPVIKH